MAYKEITCIICNFKFLVDVKREKTESALRDEIEAKKRLSHVETKEKNTLPDKKSMSCLLQEEYLIF